jgi:hypothetical protein
MAATATTLASVLKDVWTDDKLNKMLIEGDFILKQFESYKGAMIGKQALVPIEAWDNGGYTSIGGGGGQINPATNVQNDQAAYTMIYHFSPIELELSAIAQASGPGLTAVVSSKNQEIASAIRGMRRQMNRQLITNGDSIIAQCATSGGSTVVPLVASPSGTAWGYDALRRYWLQTGMAVDIGATTDTDSLVTASTITAFDPTPTAPTITIGTSITTTAGTHFVYHPNLNSATAANPEMNGLRNMVNTSGALGGLNPATAGKEYWRAPIRDTTTTVLSLDLVSQISREIMQNTDKPEVDVWTGLKQASNYNSLLQNQVRFAGDVTMGAHFQGAVWNGNKVSGRPEFLDSDWWAINPEDFVRVVTDIEKPTWMTSIYGGQSVPLAWKQMYTSGVDAICYPMNVGMRRRNGSAGATALTA